MRDFTTDALALYQQNFELCITEPTEFDCFVFCDYKNCEMRVTYFYSFLLLIFFLFSRSNGQCPGGDDWTTTLEGNQCFKIFDVDEDYMKWAGINLRVHKFCDRRVKSASFDKLYPLTAKTVAIVFTEEVRKGNLKLNLYHAVNRSILMFAHFNRKDQFYFDKCFLINFLGVETDIACTNNWDHYACYLPNHNPNRHCRFKFETVHEPCKRNNRNNRCERKIIFVQKTQATGKYRQCEISAINVNDVQPCNSCSLICPKDTKSSMSLKEVCDCTTGIKYTFEVSQYAEIGVCKRKAVIKTATCLKSCADSPYCRWHQWSEIKPCSNKCGKGVKILNRKATNTNLCAKGEENQTIECWEYTGCDHCQVSQEQINFRLHIVSKLNPGCTFSSCSM